MHEDFEQLIIIFLNMVAKIISYRFSANASGKLLSQSQDMNFLLRQGYSQYQQGKLSQAQFSFEQVLSLQPDNLDALQILGVIAGQSNNHTLSVKLLNKAIEVSPESFAAHLNLGLSLMALNRVEEAIVSYDCAIKLMPECADAYNNRGVALESLNRSEEALKCYDRTLLIKPDFARAYYNRGVSLASLGRFSDAIKSYDLAIKLNPRDADSYFNKSLVLLTLGDFRLGWRLYEWRWDKEDATEKKRNLARPLCSSSNDFVNKNILLYAEQGFGDTIQFSRYVSVISQLGGNVILEVQSPLVNLLSGLEGVSQVFSRGQVLPSFDYECPLMSLPLALGTDINSIPKRNSYLFSCKEKRHVWMSKLGEKRNPRIGLVWSGNSKHQNDHNRSIPLSELIRYLPDGFEYISLQREMRETDHQILCNSSIRYFGNDLSDFSDTAALCDLKDLIVSVDTSVAHLAGALGRPTWVLLPYRAEFRWLLDRDDSTWYPSCKLYRQSGVKRWDMVLDIVAEDLLKLFH